MCAGVFYSELQACGYRSSERSLVSRNHCSVSVGCLDKYRTAAVDCEAGKRHSEVIHT